MAWGFMFLGIILIVAGARNTIVNLGQLLVGDFTSGGSFWTWVALILIIGGVGYYKPLEKPSRLFLLLIILVMILNNQGVFVQLTQAFQNVQKPTPSPQAVAPAAPNTSADQYANGGIPGTTPSSGGVSGIPSSVAGAAQAALTATAPALGALSSLVPGF